MTHVFNSLLLPGVLSKIIHGMAQKDQERKGSIYALVTILYYVFLTKE